MEIDVFHSLEKPDLFEKFKTQLTIDFELCGLLDEAPQINSNNLNHVYSEVLNSIYKLEKNGANGLMNLLYRIDISETQINNAVRLNEDKGLQEVMAELIIKRILQKVILKEKYSN